MDFTLTEAQVELAGLTRTVLADREPDDTTLWSDLASSGVLAATLPVEVDGDGLGLAEQCSILGELGRAAAGLPFLPSIVVAAGAVARFGDERQARLWASPAGRGQVMLTAALTPHTATLAGDTLTGVCEAVPAAGRADAFLIPTPDGVFVVERGDAGVSVREQEVAGGPGAGVVTLSEVPVPPVRRLPAAAGAWLRDRWAVGLVATQVGVLERLLELTAEHARTRVQFGRAIGSFQAVAQRLADAYIDVEGVRLTTWQAVWHLARDTDDAHTGPEVATAAFWAAEAGHRVAHTCVHVHGGVGIDLDHIVQRYFLAAKYHEFALGGATAQLLAIGAALARSAPALAL